MVGVTKLELTTGQSLSAPDVIAEEFASAWNGDPHKAAQLTVARFEEELRMVEGYDEG